MRLFVVMCVAACAGPDPAPSDPAPGPDPAPYSCVEQSAPFKPYSGCAQPCGASCGGNGGLVGGLPFAGFWLDGTVEGGLMYLGFAPSVAEADLGHYALPVLDVEGSLLRRGSDPNQSVTAPEHGILVFKSTTSDIFYVQVHHVYFDGTPYWTDGYASGLAVYYDFRWRKQDDPTHWTEVCPGIDAVDNDLWFDSTVNAFAFEGDHYDPNTRLIKLTPTTPHAAWVNVACFGSLAAKMLMSRRAVASSDGATYISTIDDDRQALVHAWAAEYCGSGKSFTHTGHRLRILDKKAWFPDESPFGWTPPAPLLTYEAVWDKTGAVCIATPRMSVWDPNIPIDPGIQQKITDWCGTRRPPPCPADWFPVKWKAHGLLATATGP